MRLWLETSVLVALHFRSAREAAECRKQLPAGELPVVSAYVLYELARGFLRRIIELHNRSRECVTEHELRLLAKSGDAPYNRKGRTWTDMLDDDLLRISQLKEEDGARWRALSPRYFQVRLRRLIHGGWEDCTTIYERQNPTGCRYDLPSPEDDGTGLLRHDLPTAQCGQPGNCGVLAFVQQNAAALERVRTSDGKLKGRAKIGERERRREGLGHLLAASETVAFAGEHCHGCGDAMIAMEAVQEGGIPVTKDREFPRLCKALGGIPPLTLKHVL
jgi:predicted nucleic acid-binding protein